MIHHVPSRGAWRSKIMRGRAASLGRYARRLVPGRTLTVGVPTDLIQGDLFNWPAIMAAILIPSIPLALLYNAFLNRFIAGFTGGAFR